VLTHPDIQVTAPVVFHSLIDDGLSCFEPVDAIRTRAKRRLEGRCRNIAGMYRFIDSFPPVFWQNRQLTEDQRQLAIAGTICRERDVALAGHLVNGKKK
jgi:hypothetical protein